MKLRRLIKNQLMTLLTQEKSHEEFFENEIHGHAPQPPLSDDARRHLERWHMPEQGFRNYWYPVMMASDLATGRSKGGCWARTSPSGATAARSTPSPIAARIAAPVCQPAICAFPARERSVAPITAGLSTGLDNSAPAFKKDPIPSCRGRSRPKPIL